MDKTLRQAVLDRLSALDEAAAEGQVEVLLPLARRELYRLAQGYRTVLAEHEPDAGGRCPVCSGRMRSRRWPCPAWNNAHDQLIGDQSVAWAYRHWFGALRETSSAGPALEADSSHTEQQPAQREDEPPPIYRAAVVEHGTL